MTLIPRDTLRPVRGGHRHEMTCGCAFLYTEQPDGASWIRYHVVVCNQRFEGEGQHTHQQAQSVTELPEVPVV